MKHDPISLPLPKRVHPGCQDPEIIHLNLGHDFSMSRLSARHLMRQRSSQVGVDSFFGEERRDCWPRMKRLSA